MDYVEDPRRGRGTGRGQGNPPAGRKLPPDFWTSTTPRRGMMGGLSSIPFAPDLSQQQKEQWQGNARAL